MKKWPIIQLAVLGIIVFVFAQQTNAVTRLVPSQYTTIQCAINACLNNDSVLVAPGNYSENISLGSKLIVVRGLGGPFSTTITAANVDMPVVSFGPGCPKGAEVSGFTITGSKASGVYCSAGSPLISNNVIERNRSNQINGGAGIELNSTSQAVIRKNIIRHDTANTYGAAIHLEVSQNDTICYNLIYNCEGFIEIRCLSSNAQIYNNTVEASFDEAISNQDAGTITCRNNICFNAPVGAMYGGEGGCAVGKYNCVYSTPMILDGICVADSGNNFQANPMFLPTFLLAPGSPCIDAGDPDPFFNDADGSRSNIGADLASVCCFGRTGNANCDANDQVDIADVTTLIDHLFVSLVPLCCHDEGNFDGLGGVDVSDLTKIIASLFITFEQGALCD